MYNESLKIIKVHSRVLNGNNIWFKIADISTSALYKYSKHAKNVVLNERSTNMFQNKDPNFGNGNRKGKTLQIANERLNKMNREIFLQYFGLQYFDSKITLYIYRSLF